MPVEWADIEQAATKMFNIWKSCGDLVFAEECWKHFAIAGLTDDRGVVAQTETYLRLIALRLFYEQFCRDEWDENAETYIEWLAEDLEINDLALGLLVSPYIGNVETPFGDGHDLRKAALTIAVEALQSKMISCLKDAYGGHAKLHERMLRSAAAQEFNK